MKTAIGVSEWRTVVKKELQKEEARKEDTAWIFKLLGWEKNVRKRT